MKNSAYIRNLNKTLSYMKKQARTPMIEREINNIIHIINQLQDEEMEIAVAKTSRR